jgi:hypothetical protein
MGRLTTAFCDLGQGSVRGRSGVLSNPFSHSKGWSGLSGVYSHFSLLRVYACTCEVLTSVYFTHKGFTLVPLTGLNRSPTNGTGTPDQTMTGNHSLQCGPFIPPNSPHLHPPSSVKLVFARTRKPNGPATFQTRGVFRGCVKPHACHVLRLRVRYLMA